MRYTEQEDNIVINTYNRMAGNSQIIDIAFKIRDKLEKIDSFRSLSSITGRIYTLIHNRKLKWKSQLKV